MRLDLKTRRAQLGVVRIADPHKGISRDPFPLAPARTAAGHQRRADRTPCKQTDSRYRTASRLGQPSARATVEWVAQFGYPGCYP